MVNDFVVRITDEFNTVFSLECSEKSQVIDVVTQWINNLDSTPIYNIDIEINSKEEENV